MNADPHLIALREIADTKHLLESLAGTPDWFDYFRARATLEELEHIVRLLAKLSAEMESVESLPSVIPFPAPQTVV